LGSAENLDDEEYQYCYVTRNDVISIQVISKYKTQYIITYQNISDLMATRDQNYHLYRNIIIVSSIIIAAILYVFVWYITRPLNNVTKMAEKFSSGDYSVRINSSYEEMKSLELEQLGSTFNQMANNLENYISEVELTAKRKEDFVGKFTHELKTPIFYFFHQKIISLLQMLFMIQIPIKSLCSIGICHQMRLIINTFLIQIHGKNVSLSTISVLQKNFLICLLTMAVRVCFIHLLFHIPLYQPLPYTMIYKNLLNIFGTWIFKEQILLNT